MWIREQLAELGDKRLYILSGHNRMMVELPSNSEVYQDEFLSFFLSLLGRSGICTQGFMLAWQDLYHLSYSTSLGWPQTTLLLIFACFLSS
jgi:hypothetical protein